MTSSQAWRVLRSIPADRWPWLWFAGALRVGLCGLLAAFALGASPARAQTADEGMALPAETEAALQQILDTYLARTSAPGALVGVWLPGRGSFVRAQGTADLATAAPLTEADTVRIGSLTKTFVATLVLQLVDEGRLRLDDPAERYVPGLPYGGQITVRHLLGMTSGLANFLEDPAFLAAYEADPLLPFSPQQALSIARAHPPDFPPGGGFHYSETNYVVLGLIIEQVTRLPMSEAIDRHLARPLGLTSTGLPTSASMPAPFAHGYRPTADGRLDDVSAQNPDVAWTAGAMVSSLHDLHVWTRALATGALLSPELQAERLRWSTVPGGEPLDAGYGLGILSLAGFLGHDGGLPGYSSLAMYLPEADATIVVLVNASTLEGGPADRLFYSLAGRLFPERFATLGARP